MDHTPVLKVGKMFFFLGGGGGRVQLSQATSRGAGEKNPENF